MIKSLSREVQAQLRSGIAIFSLQQCVEELVLNSIDAGATCVAVKIDIEACKVQVIDNGSGMDRENMEKVGIRYCTSKCSSLEDLDNLCFHGFRGEAIASMVTLATMVEVSSRTKLSIKTFVKRFNEGKASEVFEAQTTRPSSGTTVLICNFFHNMPVRRKRMDSVLEVERVRQRVEAISLMHSSVSFTVKKDCSGILLVQLPKARNTYYRFVQIHGFGKAQKLREVNHTYGKFQMMGYIACEGHYNNSLQYLFVNSRLLLKTRIHKLFNCLLKRLSSSNGKTNSPNASPVILSPKQRGGPDLHGVYIINLKCPYSEYDVCLEPAKSLIEFKDWDDVLFCIEEGIKSFLVKENLVSECSVSDVQNLGSGFTNQESSPIRNVEMSESENFKEGFKETGSSVVAENTDYNVQTVEQELESAALNLQSEQCSDSDLESKVQVNVTDKPLPNSFISGTENKEKDDKMIEDYYENVLSTDVSEFPVCVNNNNLHFENAKSRIALTGHEEAYDSLKRFAEPYLNTAPKRKLSLLSSDNQTGGCDQRNRPKIPRVTPSRKLTLSFETGSLDKFKRMFENEIKPQAMNTQLKDGLCPEVSVDSSLVANAASSSLLISEDAQVDFNECSTSLMNDSLLITKQTKTKNSTSASKRKKISLAAKLSHKVDAAKPQQCELNAQNDSVSKTLSDFAERFTDFLSDQCMLENNQELLPHSASNEITETAGPLENYPSDEPRVTAPHRQDVSTPTSTLITGGTKLTENMTSLDPESASGQMLYPLSQHDPLPTKAGNEEQTANENQGHEGDKRKLSSSGWLTHYDNVLGKLVHINQVTGLSKYDNPLLEETSVPCTTDVTNMAISVVSSTGFEYRCYPFQTKLVLPFLPKPRAERVLSSSINCEDPDEGPSSLSTLFSKWNNPVFVRPPQVAMDVSSGQAEDLAVKVHNILFPYRFTKDMIHSMKVINQVDKKFLACLINTTGKETTGSSKENLLVLVDQHAAHERVRLEGLVTESYEDSPDTPGKKRLCSSSVSPPLEINVTEEEMRLLRLYQSFLRDMALEISFPVTEKSYVLLKRLPACFIEKENTEKRRGRRSVIKSIAEEYLREHIEFLHSTGRVRGTLPLTVHNVLASQACHGAIKFNDDLSTEECFSLVAALSSCHLPFQCAHGRPSILPLADLLHLNTEQEFPKPNLRKLRRMYKAWQLYGNN
ncbi:DNA mismatch repair protein Mlh3 isoform X2 [Trichomycterus rosablanca]|uniref:DNA mismatch repair protein Mlh3 isoform X2 n=1 Tax=Trichomycterus rosablanca TaxID=2290929 RepID=UPI002F3567D0